MRPEDLAAELGVRGVTLRNWWRATYPRPESARGSSWTLSSAQANSARDAFAERRTRSITPAQISLGRNADWYWEGNVQKAIVRHLRRQG